MMSGIFGNDPEDRMRERELDAELERQFTPMECGECGYTFETVDIDDDGLCPECARQKKLEADDDEA